MSFIPGTEYRMIPQLAPKAAHGRNYKNMQRRRATTDRDMKLINMMYQNPLYAKQQHASVVLRQNFLNQQSSSNMLNEMDRLKGILSSHRNPSLNDGRALETRVKYLQNRMTELKPQPLSGPEGLYLY
jgi:hypothetical protein